MKCGVTVLPKAGVDDDGEEVDMKPESGSEFCMVFATVTNDQKRPLDGTPSLWGVETKDGTTYTMDDADLMYGSYEGVEFGGFQDNINPGKTRKFVNAFEVPKGKRPTAALALDPEDGMSEAPDNNPQFELPKA